MDLHQWRECLMTGQWFSHLPASLQNSLLDSARLRRLTAGQCLFRRGDPPCGLYAVLEGTVRVGAVSEQGKEALLSLMEAPHWFGEICLFDGQPRTHDAYAEGACHPAPGAAGESAATTGAAAAILAPVRPADEPQTAPGLYQPGAVEPDAGPGAGGQPPAGDGRRLR